MKTNVIIDGGRFKTATLSKSAQSYFVPIGHWAWRRGIFEPVKSWNTELEEGE